MNDLVSVLIPVFNIQNYIGKCLESIIQQSYTNIEIIIVNDGSSDESEQICKQYAKNDTRILYIYQENKGSVGARKTGLIHAKGKYIVFVDGDDYVERDYVEKLYEFMVENDVDFVHSNYMIHGKNQTFIKQVHLFQKDDLSLGVRIDLLRDYVFEWEANKEIIDCNLYGCIYKKDVIYDCYMRLSDSQQYGEDLLCLCNLMMKCESMMFIPNAYYHYVIREGSLDHPEHFMTALSNKVSLYNEVEKILREYKIISTLIDKCQMFFIRKIYWDFRIIPSEKVQMKETYVCKFIDLLWNKKIILYGAGSVGQSVYEQLSNFANIEIVAWVDLNYMNIYSPYKYIGNPVFIPTLKFDYVVVAIKEKSMAEEVTHYLSQINIDRKSILWQPYAQSFSLSIQ